MMKVLIKIDGMDLEHRNKHDASWLRVLPVDIKEIRACSIEINDYKRLCSEPTTQIFISIIHS